MTHDVQTRYRNPYTDTHVCQMLIGGRWVDAASGARFDSINPSDGSVWAELADGDATDIDRAVQAARLAYQSGWRDTTPGVRAAHLRRLGDLLATDAVIERLAIHELLDTGKVIREALGLARAFSSWCYYFAGLAENIHGETIPVSLANTFTYTVRRPVGVVGAITPWNSPILLTLWKLCPALAAGNTVVVKPSEVASVSTIELAKVITEAGLPDGVVNVVTGQRDAGAALAAHPGIDKIAFTGSTATGRRVMRSAADNLTRVSLELGGKSPNIVFADADLDLAVNGIVAGSFAAAGQMCTAGSRVLVERPAYDAVVQAVAERAAHIRIGDPFDGDSDMGALTWSQQYDSVRTHIDGARADGATLHLGGGRPQNVPSGGFYVEPTIFTDVRPNMALAREEIFGPVAAFIPFDDEQQAIEIANDNDFGLTAAVWTNDLRRTHRLLNELEAGTVWVNCYRRFSPMVPFGGVKSSGIGRENGVEVMREYTESHTAWIDTGSEPRDPFRLT
jgi:acyl-CoA reductase-like NAD-dependent aldehyde dehydrogenase